jgi:hypothetical protein
MTANTGVTHLKYLQVHMDDSAGTLTNLSAYVNAPGTFGLKYEEVSVVALSDAIKGIVKGWPESPISLQFIPHTTAFSFLTGIITANTPLAFDFRIGVLHAWESGEPTYGLTGTATNGILCTGFTFDGSMITATFNMSPGSAAPAWSTSAHT